MNVYGLTVYVAALAVGAYYGVLGVAWALFLATGLLVFPVDFWLRHRLVGMKVADYCAAILPAILSGAAMLILLVLADRAMLNQQAPLLRIACLFLLGSISYIALIWRWQRQFLCELFQLVKGN
jgi:hypothetical protein